MNVVFAWDWKDQPPVRKIAEAAFVMPAASWFYEPDTGGDFYAAILSDTELTDRQQQRILEAQE